MPKGPIRRGQLIAPFGAGAMTVIRDGTCVIAAGLDHWFEREDQEQAGLVPEEFRVDEWRLERLLRVDHFRLPPDFRKKQSYETTPNCYLTVPFLRFPAWHHCASCNLLHQVPATARGRVECPECEQKGRKRFMVQVRFVAMCDNGHIQDFPWKEWVHRSVRPTCDKPLRLISSGGATLASEKVVCDCEASRTLERITEYDDQGSFLSSHLAADKTVFLCRGDNPWLDIYGSGCDRHLRGTLRTATNVYFASVKSAITLPQADHSLPSDLVTALRDPPFSTLIKLLTGAGAEIQASHLRTQYPTLLLDFTDEQINAALKYICDQAAEPGRAEATAVREGDDMETGFRRAEYEVLQTEKNEKYLRIRQAKLTAYEPEVGKYFQRLMLVEKLRETRAFWGFTRVYAENQQTFEQRRALLWRSPPPANQQWLPAYVVFGEGLFLEFNEALIRSWLRQNGEAIQKRAGPLLARYASFRQRRRLPPRNIGARFILLHTFAHLVINQLSFECGYSSSALRERLYTSDNASAPMAGILIYTAAGDVEGTLGGLVRRGTARLFEPMVRRAIEATSWCSADPVCMELGASAGQGPDSCNLAACHNCALVPETACEEFNRLLDRALVVGSLENPALGFFSDLITPRGE
jgi:hypothetical protein